MKNLIDLRTLTQLPDELAQRVYTSRLLGGDHSMVMHGGGNTSLKVVEDGEEILYVKGSGSDLGLVETADFAPVRLVPVRRLIELKELGNDAMIAAFRAALKHPHAPRPSIETLLHAVLPFKWVEHTHADAVLAVADTPHGADHLRAALGDAVVIVPYRHSGFELAKCCHQVFTRDATAKTIGMVLLHHGIFAFGNSAAESYGNMIELVGRAEDYLKSHAAWDIPTESRALPPAEIHEFAALRRDISRAAGAPLLLRQTGDPLGLAYARRPDLAEISQQGPATPHHAVFAKRVALLGRDATGFASVYARYLADHAPATPAWLPDPAPRVMFDPEWGLSVAAVNAQYADTAAEIAHHAMEIAWRAQALERYTSLPPREVLAAEIDYGGFELKIRRAAPLSGEVALVAGALARRDEIADLLEQGAAVIGLDEGEQVAALFASPAYLGFSDVKNALSRGIHQFGGIDRLLGGNERLEALCRPLLALSPVTRGH
ncbi:MAG: class II aldolase/adducin family protein [Sulfuricella sp.]|nr:class II aldolase/adducin family protein [Sulfuricella sp.]